MPTVDQTLPTVDQTLPSRAADHLCRVCFGRIFERQDGLAWCSGCEASGPTPEHLCFCSTTLGDRNAQLKCVPNPNRSPDNPSVLAVSHPGVVRQRQFDPRDADTPRPGRLRAQGK